MKEAAAISSLEADIRQRLAILSPVAVELVDDSAKHAGHTGARNGGRHYRLRIVSHAFVGQDRLSRQRLIHDALGDLLNSAIHALSIQASAPEHFTAPGVSDRS
ncbi:MAG TPA: BolA family protein [Accumulibacter sp.]|uniref:BolA family protein n=1 Tax=Accumulibacter sp. TaxID=2053492 RepID=UPI002BF89962|nr:BolA family protein [Accumulibacter sp.]HMW19174.1 BolA family protein [Accumulibacter sp.]HMX23217.1 BolA family protein [Accumulibacter sp.]HMY07241.1 BolA family protein [Accumulibacter sp.]HNC20249.1 BolA family protein [Accumulibacter sp.]HNG39889.1 BolA family protein [Accumulibacter sp.]